jgi:hypothetical protein
MLTATKNLLFTRTCLQKDRIKTKPSQPLRELSTDYDKKTRRRLKLVLFKIELSILKQTTY